MSAVVSGIDACFGTARRYRVGQTQSPVEPFSLTHFYTDIWGADLRLLDAQHHTVGKANTQKLERKHLTLRTRIKRLAR